MDKRDQKALCEVSKILLQIALPFLYERITISFDEGLQFPTRFHHFSTYSKKYSSLVKELAFESPFKNELEDRCPHSIWCSKSGGDIRGDNDIFKKMEDALSRINDRDAINDLDSINDLDGIYDPDGIDGMERLSVQLLPFLECFGDNTMRNFR